MITVVGCGISGLTCSIALRRAGQDADIVAESLPPDTTSDHAGALCFPFKAGPRDRCLAWAAASIQVYAAQAMTGDWPVAEVECLVLSASPLRDLPWQMERLGPDRLRVARPDELPGGYASGHVVRVPLMQTGPYLQKLMYNFNKMGGTIRRMKLARLDEAPGDMVINCTGLGAGQLAQDPLVTPISGCIVKVLPAQAVRCFMDEDNPNGLAYAFPRPDVCVLGGTADPDDWDTAVKDGAAEAILARTAAIEPALAEACEIERYVCLRPGRSEVRLEAGTLADGRKVVHDYGHGGSGWTLAWGCAREVVQIVRD